MSNRCLKDINTQRAPVCHLKQMGVTINCVPLWKHQMVLKEEWPPDSTGSGISYT